MNPSRRALLFGRKASTIKPALRPPWAVNEALFVEQCTQCNHCLTACPEQILIKGDGGYPVVDFALGECSFCQSCVEVCNESALSIVPDAQPWHLKANIMDSCLSYQGITCQSCTDMCEPRALTTTLNCDGTSIPLVDLNKCTGCGACVQVCPSRSIELIHLPEHTGSSEINPCEKI
jgi:ferredoxin-type protein NapF